MRGTLSALRLAGSEEGLLSALPRTKLCWVLSGSSASTAVRPPVVQYRTEERQVTRRDKEVERHVRFTDQCDSRRCAQQPCQASPEEAGEPLPNISVAKYHQWPFCNGLHMLSGSFPYPCLYRRTTTYLTGLLCEFPLRRTARLLGSWCSLVLHLFLLPQGRRPRLCCTPLHRRRAVRFWRSLR